MQVFSKFKQLSREIKLIIITALIVSCVGVYAAGECIISATADDVTYGNTTVQAAIDELYSKSESCPEGYECNKRNLYNAMAKNSVLDDRASTYVTSSTGIDFTQISSDTNGKGIYEIASTKNDTYPIYYYRGDVSNNNVKFAGFCWKAIRTTDTGGVKIIYNGLPDQDGYCTNTTGTDTQIGKSVYNTSRFSPSDVGFMYGPRYNYTSKPSSELNTAYKFGGNVTYSGGTYTLTNIMTSTGTWTSDYNTLNNNHYTCFSTGTTCSSVYYIHFTDTSNAWYITLTDGKKIDDAIDEMFNGNNTNSTNPKAKTEIDNWYSTNLASYSSYIEDTVYCDDRSVSSLGGFNPNGGDTTEYLNFSPQPRTWTNHIPTLVCPRALDRFTVSSSNGNGALTYPVGLITSDEAMYAGGRGGTANNTYYLHTGQNYWGMSSSAYKADYSLVMHVAPAGDVNHSSVAFNCGLRPVISINNTSLIQPGCDGTSTNPYVISTN